jgi:hypothetical protein
MTEWQWSQPATQAELLQRLADARDLAVPERERENLCACAHAEIARLQEEVRLWEQAAVPTDEPVREGKTLILNAYGMVCYDAGRAQTQAEREAALEGVITAAKMFRDERNEARDEVKRLRRFERMWGEVRVLANVLWPYPGLAFKLGELEARDA